MTPADAPARDLLELLDDPRPRAACPVCRAVHCLTAAGRLWTHGRRGARCRGSRCRIEAARYAAGDVRGGAR